MLHSGIVAQCMVEMQSTYMLLDNSDSDNEYNDDDNDYQESDDDVTTITIDSVQRFVCRNFKNNLKCVRSLTAMIQM